MNRKIDQIDDRTCGATTAAGSPCSAKAQEGEDWCFFHDPAKVEERRAAQIRGGQGNRASSPLIDVPDFAPETVGDVVPLLIATINQVRRRELTPSAGTTICNLANSLMKALYNHEL